MPFASRRQQRAMYAGAIPGLDKKDAKEWSKDTDFSKLPERAPKEKGKPTLRSKKANGDMMAYFQEHPDKYKAYRERQEKKEMKKHQSKTAAAAAFVPVIEQLAEIFKFAGLGTAVTKPSAVGKFRGMMTSNALKPPGYAASKNAINPQKGIVSAMNANKPHAL